MMVFPREVLNELKWRTDLDLRMAEISYVDRGSPGDTKTVSGSEVTELGRSFFRVGDTEIPYHRIKKIVYRGVVLYDSSRPKEPLGSEERLGSQIGREGQG